MAVDPFLPDDQTLRQFLLGHLSVAESEVVERYLETHPEAADTLHALSSEDTLTSALRHSPVVVDAEVQAVIDHVERSFAPASDQTTALGSVDESFAATRSVVGENGDETEDGLDFLSLPATKDELGRLGGYRILRVLGAGGMGMVLDAEDPKLARHVAIKVMRPRVASNLRARDRFVREAQAAAKVDHDHIIPIWYIGEDNGVPFIVMPFLKGESLDARLKREGRLPVADIMRIGRETAEGLAAAHDSGLVHRDIKPGNLWLESPRGRVKVLDFGLARLNSDAGQLTQSGAILGTPAYMAPEQARSQGVDGRSDLFSLGAVLYRAATGRTPFGGTDTMSMLMSLANDTPADPRSLNPELPPYIAKLIMRLLEKDPAKRPQSAREVVNLLVPPPVVEALPESGERRAEFEFDRDDATQMEVPLATAAEPEATGRPKRERGRSGLFVGVAVALLFLVGGGLGAYKLFFETKDGRLIVEVDGDADARFKNGKLQIYDETGKLLYTLESSEQNKTLPPGKYQIKVTGADGLKANTSEFKLEKGGKTTVQVIVDPNWKPATVAKNDKPDVATEKVANYALEFDGKASHVEIPSLTHMKHGSYTIEAWVTPDSSLDKVGSNIVRVIGPAQLQVSLLSTGQWQTSLHYQSASGATAKHLQSPRESPAVLGKRVHVAYVLDDVQKPHVRLFVDGKLAASELQFGILSKLPPTVQALQKTFLGVGIDDDNKNKLAYFFRGRIDEVRISRTPRYKDEFTPSPRHENDTDTIALFHCDEGQGDTLMDSSGNGKHGRVIGAKWVESDGSAIGSSVANRWALRFEGKSDKVGPIPLALDISKPFTVEGYALVEKGTADSHMFVALNNFNLRAIAKKWEFNLRGQEKNSWNANAVSVASMHDQMVHIAGVFTGKEMLLFLDGKLAASKNVESNPPHAGPVAITIGSGFQGVLDELRISTIARYAKDFVPDKRFTVDQDTLALYHADEGMGEMLKDSSGRGHHGSIVGAKWLKAKEASADPDRRAAEYVLSIGGSVRVNQQEREITNVVDLPREPFELTRVWLRANTKVTDASLAAFQGCKNLRHLDLSSTGVGDAGMVYFKDCKKLNVIDIPFTKVGDAGIAHFEGCNELVSLWLGSTKVTDKGLIAFKGCKHLNHIDLVNTGTTDIGLAYFQESKNLANLFLDSTAITNDGLALFKDNRLTSLLLGATKTTDKGLLNLSNVKDLATLNLGDTKVTSVGVGHFRNCKELRFVYLSNIPVGDDILNDFAKCNQLQVLDLEGTHITDGCARRFKECLKLRELRLRKTKVSAAVANELHKALPNCRIQFNDGVLEPTKVEGPGVPKQSASADRQLAEWVIKRGGRAVLVDGPKTVNASKMEDLLSGPIAVQTIVLMNATSADFQDLAKLVGMGLKNNSIELSIHGSRAADDSLKHLCGLSISKLFLHDTHFGDACAQHLIRIKGLKSLTIWESKMTADGVKRLAANLASCAIDTPLGKYGFAAEEPFVSLFNGKDLTNWQTYDGPINGWIVEGGELIGNGGGSRLYCWPKIYEDFHLKIEAKITAGGIAQISTRSAFTPETPNGYVWKLSAADADQLRTGSVQNLGAVVDKTHGADEWVTLEFIARGEQIDSRVNGKSVLSFKERRFAAGVLALNVVTPGATVRFRKIEVKNLTPTSPSRVLCLDQFVTVFDVTTAEQWRTFENDMRGWKVDSGAIVSAGPSRNLYFGAPFQNFHLKAEVFVGKDAKGAIGMRGPLVPDEESPQHYSLVINGDPASKTMTGSIDSIADSKVPSPKAEEWLTIEATCHGNRIITKVNGSVAVEVHDRRFHSGRLFVSNKSNGTFKIRRIEVRDLSPTVGGRYGAEFTLVPKGKAWLGGGNGKQGDRETEFKDDFYIGVYEVTQEEWERVIGKNPSHFSREGSGKDAVAALSVADLKRLPVDSVSWEQAQAFVTLLNLRDKHPGWTYRLPTSDEWEFACRGGPVDRAASAHDYYLSKPLSRAEGNQLNFLASSLNRTTPVGSYESNRLGLHDMHGNVWEWCNEGGLDKKGVAVKCIRGGGWDASAQKCRAAGSYLREANVESKTHGLRLVRVRDDAVKAPVVEKK